MQAPGDPAVMIDSAIAKHLEILRDAAARLVLAVEGVGHADAFDRLLRHAVHHARLSDAGEFEDGRCNVDDVMELRAQPALVLDALRPGHDEAVAGAAEVRGDLFHPLERRRSSPAPADGIMVLVQRPAYLVDVL